MPVLEIVGLCCIGGDTEVFVEKLELVTLGPVESEVATVLIEGGSILKIGNGDFGMAMGFDAFKSDLTLVNVGFAIVTAIVGNGIVVVSAGAAIDTIGIDFGCC